MSVAERQGSASGEIEFSYQRELAEGFEYGSGCFRKRLLKHKQLNYIAEFSKALLAEQKKNSAIFAAEKARGSPRGILGTGYSN